MGSDRTRIKGRCRLCIGDCGAGVADCWAYCALSNLHDYCIEAVLEDAAAVTGAAVGTAIGTADAAVGTVEATRDAVTSGSSK